MPPPMAGAMSVCSRAIMYAHPWPPSMSRCVFRHRPTKFRHPDAEFMMRTPHRRTTPTAWHAHPYLGRLTAVGCLLTLHAAVIGPLPLAPLLLVHLGLFLLWQPVWPNTRIGWLKGLAVLALVFAAVLGQGEALLAPWTLVLIGISGSCNTTDRHERLAHLLFTAALLIILLIGCMPRLLALPVELDLPWHYASALPALSILLVPARSAAPPPLIDLVQGLMLALLASLLALGSVLLGTQLGIPHVQAVFWTLLATGLSLIGLTWLLSPRLGLLGLSHLWVDSRLHLPQVEQWLAELSFTAQQVEAGPAFLDEALKRLTELPWIRGVRWSTGREHGRHGENTAHETRILAGDLVVSVYSRRPVPGMLLLHCRLLVQLSEHFYTLKLREREQAHRALLQSVHETGARLTHEIRNLLQSLHAVLALWHDHARDADPKWQAIIDRQIKELGARLDQTLDQLGNPQQQADVHKPLAHWWQDLQRARRIEQPIHFHAPDPVPGGRIPVELFDLITANLLDNAARKAPRTITVRLLPGPGTVSLECEDDGEPVPTDQAERLFDEPVPSRHGLGIGLYQAARQARRSGYSLTLADNRRGRVCFRLHGPLETS